MKMKKMTIFIVMLALLAGLFAGYAAGNTQGVLWGGEADYARTRAAIDDLVNSAKLVTGLTTENAQLKAELITKNNTIISLQGQLETKNQELQNKQQELNQKQQELQNKQQELNDKRQEVNDKKNIINDKDNIINGLNQQINTLQNQITPLQNEVNALKDERDMLNAMLTKARDDMKALADYAELRKGEVS